MNEVTKRKVMVAVGFALLLVIFDSLATTTLASLLILGDGLASVINQITGSVFEVSADVISVTFASVVYMYMFIELFKSLQCRLWNLWRM